MLSEIKVFILQNFHRGTIQQIYMYDTEIILQREMMCEPLQASIEFKKMLNESTSNTNKFM
jgi:hypothetical protein